MIRTIRLVLASALVLGGLSAVSAQDRLFVDDAAVGAIGRFGQRVGTRPADLGPAASVFGAGRYALSFPIAYDRRTGAVVSLPSSWQAAKGDPVRARVYGWEPPATAGAPGTLVMLDLLTGVETPLMQLPLLGPNNLALRVAVDADLVFASDIGIFGSPNGAVFVADPARGVSSQRQVPLPTGPPPFFWLQDFDVSPDGARVFALVNQVVFAFDAASGARLAMASGAESGTLTWDRTLDGLIVKNPSHLWLLSAGLQVVADSAFEPSGRCDTPKIEMSPHTGRVYLLTGGGSYYGQRIPLLLHALDGTTGTWSGPVNLTASLPLFSECASMALFTAPGAPRGLQATVSGSTVSLQWQHVGLAHTFVMVAGFGPGRTDATVPLGPDSHATFSGVPPGTYYLRLRGVNEFGASRWSNEVRVVVP